jgi:hypothetical protein
MPFIGKNPTSGFSTIVKDDLTPDGSTTAFTLSKNVASANDIAVFVGNVRQEPTDAYSVSGTTLTMTAAPASGVNFYVLHIAGTLESSVIPADNTISTAKIQSGAVTDAKIASGITSSKLTGALPAIDGSALTGIVTHSTAPAFYATVSSDTALSAAAYTVAPLDTEEFDTHSFFNTSTYRFTPTIAGYYQFGITFGTTSSQTHLLQIRKNGSGSGVTLHYDFGSTRFTSNAATLISLNGSTDYVEFIVRTENSSTLRASDTRAYGYLVRTI